MKPFALILLAAFCMAVHAQEISGSPHIIDGDSIRIADVEIRITGIDAPEGKQSCRIDGRDWACGKTATKALRQIVGSANIRCTWTERDRYERALATCYKDGYNIAALMVDHGMAVAYRKYSNTYVANEGRARAAKKGVWGAEFILPWEWRRGVRLAGNELPDIDCPVKGNVNRKGNKIYHLKGWRDHAKVRLKAEKGDQCFQTVSEAESAGFREPGYALKED